MDEQGRHQTQPQVRSRGRGDGILKAASTGRVRILTCGYEPEQGFDPDAPLLGAFGRSTPWPVERWAVHLAVFSCQGDRSIPWWPVPLDTQRGDIFIIRLAPFEVPLDIRDEIAGGREIGLDRGATGRAARVAIEITGIGICGNPPDSTEVELPDHPEFSPNRRIAGEGVIGLAIAHGPANLPDYSLPCGPVGSAVIFPEVVTPVDLGLPLDSSTYGLEPAEIDVQADQWAAIKSRLFATFTDPVFEEDVGRLEAASAALASGEEYPLLSGPRPRWSFA